VQEATKPDAPSIPPSTATSTGRLEQNQIDQLLAELNPTTRRVTNAANAPASSTGGLSQDAIDQPLNDLGAPGSGDSQASAAAVPAADAAVAPALAEAVAQPSKPATGLVGRTTGSVAKPTTGSTAKPATATVAAPTAAGPPSEGPMSQDDIDKLLAELGTSTTSINAEKTRSEPAPAEAPAAKGPRRIPPAPEPVDAGAKAPPPVAAADATQALSPDEIASIVAKQQDQAPPGHESEAVIAQSDIDALVKQLAQATGGSEAQQLGEELAKHAADIDKAQEGAPPMPAPEVTRDALDVNSVLSHTQSTATVVLSPAHATLPPGSTITTVEFRAARWLLAAAVVLLGLCAGSLIVLTRSVHDLSGEIRKEREVERPVADGFAGKLELAVAKLREPDDAEQARAVRWLDELRRQHPDHAPDLALVLARHYRGRQAWRRAADEYLAVVEAGIPEDPRVLLEQAECLAALGDLAGAVRTVYGLQANEAGWLAAAPGPILDRNRQAVTDSYLVLGRLLTRQREGGTQVAQAAPAHAAPAHAAPAHDAPAHDAQPQGHHP
jgi:hypothetical protein